MGSQESVAVGGGGAPAYPLLTSSHPHSLLILTPTRPSHAHHPAACSVKSLVIVVMLVTTLLVVVWCAAEHGATSPGSEDSPSNTVQDTHKYYNLSVYQNNAAQSFDKNFIDMENAEIKHGLSNTMVGAESVKPLFSFPFYGHMVEEFFITTHGFLSLSPRLHDYIYKTQYIAPLRIKLDPSRSNSSTISVLSLPDRLTVEWSNVSVMADAEHPSGGAFTFQVTLRPNGDIVFVYIEVQPVLTTAALYDHEPVAGISDAFLLHGSELHLYSKINIDNVMINTRTVATFSARPTCIAQTSCGQCVELTRTSEFGCLWCEASGHCSDGADRLREHWNYQECHLTNTTTCSKDQSGQSGHTEWRTSSLSYSSEGLQTSTLVSAVVSSVCVLLLVILFIIFIYLYGKYNQETTIGRYIKTMQESYQQFGGDKSKFKSFPSLELGKKISEKAKAKVKPAREFVNPHPGVNNNNVITASV